MSACVHHCERVCVHVCEYMCAYVYILKLATWSSCLSNNYLMSQELIPCLPQIYSMPVRNLFHVLSGIYPPHWTVNWKLNWIQDKGPLHYIGTASAWYCNLIHFLQFISCHISHISFPITFHTFHFLSHFTHFLSHFTAIQFLSHQRIPVRRVRGNCASLSSQY